MSASLISFHGRFQVWSYSVSHGQLLLRSTRNPYRPTQIDVLFVNVAAMGIPTVFDDIEIRKATLSDFSGQLQTGAVSLHGRDFYQIFGREIEGYVIAGSVVWNEADLDYDAISPLLAS
jgi:hypothetical protein